MSKDRFDLEEAIHHANMDQDLELLMQAVMDRGLSGDALHNTLLGLFALNRMRQDHLWDVFTQVFELDQYRISSNFDQINDEIKGEE